MTKTLIQAILLLMLISPFSTSNACTDCKQTQINCSDYADKSIAQFYTSSIFSCGYSDARWNDGFGKLLRWCNRVTNKVSEQAFQKQTQMIFSCFDKQNARLSTVDLEASALKLNDELIKSINRDDKKRFIQLLVAGADLEIGFSLGVNYYADDVLIYSISQGSGDIVKLLLGHGISYNYSANKLLFDFFKDNIFLNYKLRKLFFTHDSNLLLPPEKYHGYFLALALSKAVDSGDLKTTHALLKAGANPNFTQIKTDEDFYRSPLSIAINNIVSYPANKSYELVKLLLNFGAYPNLFPKGNDDCDGLLSLTDTYYASSPLDAADSNTENSKLFGINQEESKKISNLLKNAGAVSLYKCEEKRDLLIAEVAVKNNGMELKYTSNKIKQNREIVLLAVKQNGMALEFAGQSLQQDKTIVMAALESKGKAYQLVDKRLKREKAVILQAVKNDGWVIFDVENKLIDRDIVLAGVKSEGTIISYIDKKYQSDNDIVTAAGLGDRNDKYAISHLENQPINNKKDMLELLKHGTSLALANDKLRDDKELVLAATSINARNIEYASQRFKSDKALMLTAFKKEYFLIRSASKTLRNDKDFMLKLVSINGNTLQYVSDNLRRDKQIVFAAIKQNGLSLDFADDVFKKNREAVILAVKKDGISLLYADDSLKKDKKLVKLAIQNNGDALRYADPLYQKDKEIVMLAVKNSPYALAYADKTLQADREVVLQAVRHDGLALRYAKKPATQDKGVILTAIKSDPNAINYAHKSLFSDKAFVLEVLKVTSLPFALDPTLKKDRNIAFPLVKSDALQLQNLAKELQADRKIVLLAVKNNGMALQFASPKLQKDLKIVSAAIQQNILALKYAGEPVRQNRQWILDYVQKNKSLPKWVNKELSQDKRFIQALLDKKITSLTYTNSKFSNDKTLLLATVKIDGMALRYASSRLQKDKEIVLAAVKQEAEAFQYADKQLRADKSIVLDAIKLNGRAYYYASKRLQSHKDVILAAVHQKINALQLLADNADTAPWITTDAKYTVRRIDLEKPLVFKNKPKFTHGNFVFSPNGLLFAAATELSTGRAQINIWSTKNGKLLYSTVVKRLPYYTYQGLVFSPDSKRLINISESSEYGFIWNFQQGNEPLSCGTGTELKEINSQTHSMLTNPADAPLGLYSLENCDNLGYSPEEITTSPYVISPDNKMIIRGNVFINNEKNEQVLVKWDSKKHELDFINRNYISKKNYWKKKFLDSGTPLGSASYYPDYKTRKLFFLDNKYIWIISIDTGEIINKFPLPKNSILTKLGANTFTYWHQPFVISTDNKIMVIDGGEESEGFVELINLETGKILHTLNIDDGKIISPPDTPEGIRDYCPDNEWQCLFDLKTSISPNGQFIQYGKKHSSSMLIDSQNETLILKVPALIRSNMSESNTGETMFVSLQRTNTMSLWKVSKNSTQ